MKSNISTLISQDLQFTLPLTDRPCKMSVQSIVEYGFNHPILFLYQLVQWLLDKLFSPNPPAPGARLHRPKIAIVGAGLTGVSAASHCVGHGFDVRIFEAGDRETLGGIWSVSACSSLDGRALEKLTKLTES